jgi:predicted dehydrogenase
MKPRLAFIGAGSIAPSHIEAAQAAGFDLHGICGRPNSQNAIGLTKKYNFANYFSDVEAMFATEFDAISLISKTESLSLIYREIEKLKLPILVEKPFSTNLDVYGEIDIENSKTLIGYNRRYYSSIKTLKEKLTSCDYHYSKIHISEISWNPTASLDEQIKCLFENTVHGFDLLKYLFGNYKVINIVKNMTTIRIKSIFIEIESSAGKHINLSISFGIPLNSFIEVWFDEVVVVCKPLESYSEFKDMAMFPPDDYLTYKRYEPRRLDNWKLSESDSRFKPGFLEQYKDFKKICKGLTTDVGARLTDAKLATSLAAIIANA